MSSAICLAVAFVCFCVAMSLAGQESDRVQRWLDTKGWERDEWLEESFWLGMTVRNE